MTAVPAVVPICGLEMFFFCRKMTSNHCPALCCGWMSATKAVSAGTILLCVLPTYPFRMHHGYAVSMHSHI